MNQAIQSTPNVSRLHPAASAFLKRWASAADADVSQMTVEEARDRLSKIQAGRVAKLPVDIESRTVLVGPRGNTAIRIIRPRGATALLPVVMYFHGGGWVTGDQETHDRLVREIAVGANAVVVFVEYSHSPEARWPVAIEEAYAVTDWIFQTGRMINADPSRMAVMGDGTGATIAAAVTLLASVRAGPPLRIQVLFYPVTGAAFDSRSYDEFAQGYFLTREAMKWFWNHYAPDIAARDKSTASPLRASLNELRGLPPALVITAECDIVRDEGEAYAGRLKEAEVPVTVTRYAGMIHDFVMLDALAETDAAREAIDQAIHALRTGFFR
jgi:acetyl esterase/lipase